VVVTEFPCRRLLEWAPLAMPAYIGAYALVDLLEYAGPVCAVSDPFLSL
jgi:iron(III) transport system permease protein